MNESVRIRPARPEDLEPLAAILVEGFRDKFAAAFGGRIDRAERVLADTLAVELSRGLPAPCVAELEGQIVGTLTVRRRSDAEPPLLPTSGILFRELGLWGGLRAMVCFSLLDQPIGRQDAYVSDVAVDPAHRRRGVAQALLAHAEEIARRWGKQAVVLDVSAQNEAARQLYRQLGYHEEGTRSSLLTRWLLGTAAWVRMKKPIGSGRLGVRSRSESLLPSCHNEELDHPQQGTANCFEHLNGISKPRSDRSGPSRKG